MKRGITQAAGPIPDTEWCTVVQPTLSRIAQPVLRCQSQNPVAKRRLAGPPGRPWAYTNVFVPQSLSDGRSGGQRGGVDRRRGPVWRPLRFSADGCEAVGVNVSWGLLRNTRRNLPICISSPLASATDLTGLRLT